MRFGCCLTVFSGCIGQLFFHVLYLPSRQAGVFLFCFWNQSAHREQLGRYFSGVL